MTAYLDNSATTKPCEAAVQAAARMMSEDFGNPSSLHSLGLAAHRTVENTRALLARSIGEEEKNTVVFTSGGTEANNLAVLGAAYAGRRAGNRIVTTAIEHESVLESMNELERQGFEVVRIVPDREGHITKEQIFEAVTKETILVSVMLVNNEVGTILPVEEISRAVKAAGAPALIHTDAVQAYGKLPVKVKKLGVDLMTVTAHKIHGGKGAGALYLAKGVNLPARMLGGEQERRLRGGTECTPMIAAFGAAIGCLKENSHDEIRALRDYAAERLGALDGILFNSPRDASPYILNVSVEGIRSQTLIQALSDMEIYVSNGSACAKGKKSHVLTAMGLPGDVIDSAVRVSFSRYTTRGDIDRLVLGIEQAQNALARR